MAQCLARRPAEEAPESHATLAFSLAIGPAKVALRTHSQAAIIHPAPTRWRKEEARAR